MVGSLTSRTPVRFYAHPRPIPVHATGPPATPSAFDPPDTPPLCVTPSTSTKPTSPMSGTARLRYVYCFPRPTDCNRLQTADLHPSYYRYSPSTHLRHCQVKVRFHVPPDVGVRILWVRESVIWWVRAMHGRAGRTIRQEAAKVWDGADRNVGRCECRTGCSPSRDGAGTWHSGTWHSGTWHNDMPTLVGLGLGPRAWCSRQRRVAGPSWAVRSALVVCQRSVPCPTQTQFHPTQPNPAQRTSLIVRLALVCWTKGDGGGRGRE